MKKHFLSLFLFVLSFNFFGQNYLGVMSSNYAGVMGNDVNPANFVDGRFKFDLNLFSTNVNVYQNFGYFDAEAMLTAQQNTLGKTYWWKGSFSNDVLSAWSKPDSTFIDRFIVHKYDQNTKTTLGMNMNLQVDLLNFMFHINPKIAVGFGIKARSILNIDNMDPKLAVLAEEGLEYPDLWNLKLNEELLNINHLSWTEYGLNYSQVLHDQKEHFFKAGGKVKYLQGYSAAYMYTNNFSYNLVNEDTSQYLAGDFAYGYSKNIDQLVADGGGIPKASAKFGLGLDLGFVYEWRPDWEKHKYEMDNETNLWKRNMNKYKARVGFSVLDLGGLRFEKGGLSRDFSVNTTSLFNLRLFDSANSFLNFDNVIDSLITQSTTDGNKEWVANEETDQTFYMRTPSAFSIQADYHIWKWFYVNATGMFNIISTKRATKVKVANQVSITPSFDYAWFGIHLPISMNEYSGFKAGLATRLGPLTVGITDFRTLAGKGKVQGAELFMGLRLPVLYDAPKDKDGDKVSDKMDDCVTEPGVWSFKGCPDTDGDGIKDMDDECATVPGLVEFNGCPDIDKDGIPDKDDECPTVAGIKDFLGCPDTDKDGIKDALDECPTVAGLKEFKGCPDSDSDGIRDIDDACPDVPGSIEFQGCPDKDGDGIRDIDDACPDVPGSKEYQGCPDKDADGIFDFLDACPDVAGPKENNGCPWPDTDGDGLLDKDDDCPTLAGPKSNKGCPLVDTDKDGTLDKDDDCPNTPGPKENKGCPVIEQEIMEVLNKAFDNLEFETAKDIIKDESKPSLDELADVLLKKQTWKLEIAGHTDNVGDDAKNMVLSKKRAESLKAYLVTKGVDAIRLSTLYFGETKPIGDNNTPEGRKKNRRVEMKIVIE
jgi:outer membrane protein OmpA-like peptidoglycan-associated protein